MSREYSFEKHEAFSYSRADSSGHLMPSYKEFQEFMTSGKSKVIPRCDLPDYTIDSSGRKQSTAKRDEYNELARQALNSPTRSDGKPASNEEKELAKKVAELSAKARKDSAKGAENRDRDLDLQELHDIFQKVDCAASVLL